MPKYLVSITYTAEGAKGLRKDGGTKRRTVAAKAIESLGGKLESLYFCFGSHDAIVIADLPDAASAAGLSPGHCRHRQRAAHHHGAHHARGDGPCGRQEDRLQSARAAVTGGLKKLKLHSHVHLPGAGDGGGLAEEG